MPALWYKGENRAADGLLTIIHGATPKILLVLRRDHLWAFPGGFVDGNMPGRKAAEETARREVFEETKMNVPKNLKANFLGYYTEKDRDPRSTRRDWVTTQVFHYDLGYVKREPPVTHEEDPDYSEKSGLLDVKWWSLEDALMLSWFADHNLIYVDFLDKIGYEPSHDTYPYYAAIQTKYVLGSFRKDKKNFKQIRKALEMNQSEFASFLKTSTYYVRKWEKFGKIPREIWEFLAMELMI